jgi:hypothetical protein
MSWDKWQDLGEINGAPAVASLKVGEFDAFATDTKGHLVHKKYANGTFDTSWKDLGTIGSGVTINGAPAAVKWMPDRIDIFTRGSDSKLHHAVFKDNVCGAWDNLGGGISSSPSAAGWVGSSAAIEPGNRDRLYAFARGTNEKGQAGVGYPWHLYWDGSWHAWDGNLIGAHNIYGAPAAVSWGPNRVDLFVHWDDNTLRHSTYENGKWESFDAEWNKLGGGVVDSPAAASWGPNRLDVFVHDTTNNLSRRTWNGDVWKNWESLGGELKGSPAVAAPGPNHIDCLATGTDNHLHYRILTD